MSAVCCSDCTEEAGERPVTPGEAEDEEGEGPWLEPPEDAVVLARSLPRR